MLTYKDIYTNKTFTIENNQVTDQFGNVATIPADEWVAMQGGDIVCLDKEVVKNSSYSYTNKSGNSVDVSYKDRIVAHKIIAKAFNLAISKLGDMQSRVVKLGCLVKPA